MKRLFFLTIFIFIISCGGVDFVYKEDKNLIFGQFNNVDKNESLQLKRQRRQNTFAAQVPHSYIRGPHQHYGTGKTGLKLKLRDQ